MKLKSVLIRVPATVGNFGDALDCAAMALEATMNVKVTPRHDGHVGIRYFGDHGERVPKARSNLIVRAFEMALHAGDFEFTGADFEIYSSIPVGVGLGASTAAVWSGLLAADGLYRLGLDEQALFALAEIFDPRAGNLHAAWAGGLEIRSGEESGFTKVPIPEDFILTAVIPETIVGHATQPGRARDPVHQPAVYQQAATLTKLFNGTAEPSALSFLSSQPQEGQRTSPGLDEALAVAAPGVIAKFVCGDGPAIALLSREPSAHAVAAVRACLARHGVSSSTAVFRPVSSGAREWNSLRFEKKEAASGEIVAPLEGVRAASA